MPKRVQDKTGDGRLIPTGTIFSFGGTTAPDGWLICDGTEYSRTTYKRLFAVISTNYGAGNGTTTFNVPELRGEFLRGWDNGRNVDTAGPAPGPRGIGTTQSHQYGQHTHPISHSLGTGPVGVPHSHSASGLSSIGPTNSAAHTVVGNNSGGYTYPVTVSAVPAPDTAHAHPVTGPISAANAGGTPNSSETRPRNVTVNYIIKI